MSNSKTKQTENSNYSPTISLRVYEAIRNSIGSRPPESGGLLGGNLETGVVTEFFFDESANCTWAAYSPDVRTVNRVLEEEWNPQAIRLLGFVHSHPGRCKPSEADRDYAEAILNANPELPRLLLPIVFPKDAHQDFELKMFTAERTETSVEIRPVSLQIFIPTEEESSGKTSAQGSSPEIDPKTEAFIHQPIFDRIRSAVAIEQLASTRVIWVGLGGSRGLVEELVRSGVGQHVLIDHDTVSPPNVATQLVNASDFGRPKVQALADTISELNPLAGVLPIQKRLDEISDLEFETLLTGRLGPALRRPMQALIVGCTDEFFAQARVNCLGLHFGVPTLCAQLYSQGYGGEISFVVPGVTRACQRCILSSRYAAFQKEGFRQITSTGTVPFATTWINSVSAFVALAILHRAPVNPSVAIPKRWENLLDRFADRNLVQLRFHPDFNQVVGLDNFDDAMAGADRTQIFSGDTLWRHQEPEAPSESFAGCPDCGGTGDLTRLKGTFSNTTNIKS
jgi:proteasome lid subunit RPN8/RPN11